MHTSIPVPGITFRDAAKVAPPSTDAIPKPIAISMLLDRSGSMHSIKESTIAGMNTFMESQKKHGIPTTFSLTLFDENHGLQLDHVITNASIEGIKPLDDFSPRGMTPLFDAFWDTISWFEEQTNGKNVRVLFVVITDGEENASTRHKSSELKERVSQKTAQGWEFVYLGANQDAFAVGASMGIAAGNTMSYQATPQGVMRASSMTTKNSIAYANAGDSYKTGNFFNGQNVEVDRSVSIPMSSVVDPQQPDASGLSWQSKH
jgi:hypothetical protein